VTEFLIGVYVGGSVLVFFFWTGDNKLSSIEKNFYMKMLFIWPVYVVGIFTYRAMVYLKEILK
jgi:hypothetical protein